MNGVETRADEITIGKGDAQVKVPFTARTAVTLAGALALANDGKEVSSDVSAAVETILTASDELKAGYSRVLELFNYAQDLKDRAKARQQYLAANQDPNIERERWIKDMLKAKPTWTREKAEAKYAELMEE